MCSQNDQCKYAVYKELYDCVPYLGSMIALKRFLFREWSVGSVPVYRRDCSGGDLIESIATEKEEHEDFEVCVSAPSHQRGDSFHYCEHSYRGCRIFNNCKLWAEPGATTGSLVNPEGYMITFKDEMPTRTRVPEDVIQEGLERGRYLYDQLLNDIEIKIESGLCPCETTPICAF